MSTIIKFDLKDLKNLSQNKNSCVVEKKVTQNIALQPWCLGNIKESLKNLLDYKIGKFDKEFDGILMSYKNLRVLQNVGTIRNDNPDIYFQVQADYYIFHPFVGATLTGIVNKKSNTHLVILVHRVFNVVIPRPTEEPGNMWIGTNVKPGQEVKFRIVVLDLFGALPYIRGELEESEINFEQDGYEEEESPYINPLNVSYVDFDKTRPYIVKKENNGSIDSGSPEQSKITKSSDSNKSHKDNSQTDSNSSPRKLKLRSTVESKADIRETVKSKAVTSTDCNDSQMDHKPKTKKKKNN